MDTTVRRNPSRNSARASVLSSLWDEPTGADSDSSKPTTSSSASTTPEPTKPSFANAPRRSVNSVAALAKAFSATGNENIRRAAPGVLNRINSLEHEVNMRTKSPLDKLKEQRRRNMSDEYAAARSQWIRRAGVDPKPATEGKPSGLRTLDSNLGIRAVPQEDPLLLTTVKVKAAFVSVVSSTTSSETSEPPKLSDFEPEEHVTPIPEEEVDHDTSMVEHQEHFPIIEKKRLVVSPVSASCYSVTVPETQTTVIDRDRQVSLMSNMSQFNSSLALADAPSRPSSQDTSKDSIIPTVAPTAVAEPAAPVEAAEAVKTVEAVEAFEAFEAVETVEVAEAAVELAADTTTVTFDIPESQEDGRISRSSSHYTDGSDMRNSISHGSMYDHSGRFSAQWTEVTELTIPTIDLDKDTEIHSFTLTFPESYDAVAEEEEGDEEEETAAPRQVSSRPRSRSMSDVVDETPESPRVSTIKSMFRRSRSIEVNAQFRQSWHASTALAQSPITAQCTSPITKDAMSRVPSVLGPRRPQITSLEGQASELAHHNMEPTDASSEHSVYGYMTPSQKAIRLFKKVVHPRKWLESREKKKAKAEKALQAQKNMASGYMASDIPAAIPRTTVTTSIEATESKERERKKLQKRQNRASWIFGGKTSKTTEKSASEISSAILTPGLPVIPRMRSNEFLPQ